MTGEDPYKTWDAAYVLGALAGDQRREYEDHVQGCMRCRTAVAELGGIPGVLSLLDLKDVIALDDEQPDPPLRPEVLQSVLDKVRWRQRRGRWATAAAAALAAALLAVGLVLVLHPETIGLHSGGTSQQQAGPEMIDMAKVSDTPINASIALTGFGWGTRIDMACSYGEWGQQEVPPENLGMVVVGHDGSRSEIATWLGVAGATALPSGTTPMPKDQIAAVQLVSSPDGKVLLETKV